jgi:hypothetical protein
MKSSLEVNAGKATYMFMQESNIIREMATKFPERFFIESMRVY